MDTVAVKLPEELRDRIDSYADEHDLNRSQAMRHLLRDGLDAREQTPPIVLLMFVTGVFFSASQYASAEGLTGPVGLALLAGSLILSRARARRFLATEYQNLRSQGDLDAEDN